MMMMTRHSHSRLDLDVVSAFVVLMDMVDHHEESGVFWEGFRIRTLRCPYEGTDYEIPIDLEMYCYFAPFSIHTYNGK